MEGRNALMTEKPIEVAIIGGGCASMAAAFELTKPEHGGKYHVTVYQLGWRFGGKGASGRGPADRIEEHGLHLWMGFYENGFRLMRECYRELGRDPAKCRMADWTDAFKPHNFNAVADRSPRGVWLPWTAHFPMLSGLPGDPDGRRQRWTVSDYLTRTALLARYFLDGIRVKAGGHADSGPAAPDLGGAASPLAVVEGIDRFLRYGQLATFTALNEALRFLEVALGVLPQLPENLLLRFTDTIAAAVRDRIDALVTRDDEIRRLWELWDLTLAVIRGAVRYRLMTDPRGFDAVNDYDCREWLLMNGASQRSVNSAFIRGLYDLAFAYEDGDVTRPRIAAGDALRGTLRAFFTYKGAFFWKMQSGMGDVVFAPLYEVLKRRGASIRFFHRLENVRIGGGSGGERPFVSGLEFDVQADIVGGGEYAPLVDVRGLPCWPSQPIWSQLADGERLRKDNVDFESHWDRHAARRVTLEVGRDFDFVVLGLSLGAVPYVCREILARDSRWRMMVEKVKTVPTQALQTWLSEDTRALGWDQPSVNISGFVEPFDTWADMSHLIKDESFTEKVGSLAYFCSVLPDAKSAADTTSSAYPLRRLEEVRRNAIGFLSRDIRHLWPKAVDAEGHFRWKLLVDPRGDEALATPASEGEARIDSQYVRANVNPTDRYVLTLPGSTRYRISPLDPTYDNLTVAGDWTDNGLNEGCVEAAVMSGLLAAHAISRSPALEDITGYDHP